MISVMPDKSLSILTDSKPCFISPAYNSESRLQKRLKILALNNEGGFTPLTIAHVVDCHQRTVRRWIERIEADENLDDHKRSGRPSTFTDATRIKTMAFYCQATPLPGCSSWSLRWAEDYLAKHPEIIGGPIGRSTIQRFLKSHGLHPHLNKYFLQLTDPDFFEKMEHIIELYLHPPGHLFSFDECPGIQALRKVDPTLPTQGGKPNYEGFDYKRNGTLDLMAFLEPKTGEIFGKCTTNHKTTTLCRVFTEHVLMQPSEDQIHYIFDNLSPHFNDEFCRTVAQLSGTTYTHMEPGKKRREWLQSDDKRIVIHFTPFHGSWLNMIEIWFGILQQKCLKHYHFQSVAHLREVILEFIDTWNQHFAHPFTWTYTGEGLHAKAIRRFSKLLLIESTNMDAKFLASQLLLMCNLAENYSSLIPASDWFQLENLYVTKKQYIDDIVENESKPQRRNKVKRALEKFNDIIFNIVQAKKVG